MKGFFFQITSGQPVFIFLTDRATNFEYPSSVIYSSSKTIPGVIFHTLLSKPLLSEFCDLLKTVKYVELADYVVEETRNRRNLGKMKMSELVPESIFF